MAELGAPPEIRKVTSHFLEFENKSTREANPIPDPHVIPYQDENRVPVIPGGIKEYMQNRYGPNIKIAFGSSHGNSDGSGYSYVVWEGDGEVARMAAERATINMLPPGYEGPLTKAMEEQDRRNVTNRSVRNEGLSRVMWRITENERARQMRVDQNTILTKATSEVPWDPQATKIASPKG